MRWQQLFADLAGRFDEMADEAMMAELADRQRLAAGSVLMVQRLRGAVGVTVRVRTNGGPVVSGAVRGAGPDWLLLSQPGWAELLVALQAVTAVEGLTVASAEPLSDVALRLDLRHALRGIARDRAPVIVTVGGPAVAPAGGGVEMTGTIDRVGADFLEVAQHAPWEPRRASTVRSVALVPLSAVITVRAMPAG
ncbi:MAG TPA: hypothetical protein VFM01_02200 [Nakamurella sp.]|nr:hypothetical protein [Nakamurella sp.]